MKRMRALIAALKKLPTFDKVDNFGWSGNDSRMEPQVGLVGQGVEPGAPYQVIGDWVRTDDVVRVIKAKLEKGI